jgi:branched-chain amino acid transport system substrate-binding protein
MSQRKSDLGIPLPYTWLNPSTRPSKNCTPNEASWLQDSYALTNTLARSVVGRGGDTWFFITVDYAFGHSLEADAKSAVIASGGKVLGSTRHPLNNADFSSHLLQAQASRAKVVALANAAGETRAWSKRFFDRHGRMPTSAQAAVYSAIRHYLRAIEAAGTDDAKAVMAKMREIPVNNFYVRGGKLREDGRLLHDMYFVQVKTPAESSGAWDYYKIIATIPGDQAFRPAGEDGCPLIKR